MLRRICFVATILIITRTSLEAQTIYEPVQYQYGDQNQFYYGGADTKVFERAAGQCDAGSTWGRVNGFDFASGDVWSHREVSDQPVRVYSDALPTQNATLYGFTATDAANVANASVPRYFCKADLMAATAQSKGLLIVPARAQFPHAPTETAVRPTPTTRPLMIFPVPIPPQNQSPASDKQLVASH